MAKIKNRNVTIKIIAVFFSVILWTYVMSEVNPKITKEIENIKIELINLDTLELSGITLMEPKEVTVNVKLSGRRKDLTDIGMQDIIAQVNLRGLSEGLHKVNVEVKTYENKIEIVDYYPKQIVFKFDKIVQKQKPIILKFTGQEGAGYIAGKGIIKPSTVYIKGPRTLVNSVANVVAIVNLNKSTEDIITSVPLKAVNDKGNEVEGVIKEPNIVDIEIPILKVKNVPIKPQIVGTPMLGYEITNVDLNPSYIKIKGPEEVISNIIEIKTEPINVDYINKSLTLNAFLVLPDKTELFDNNADFTNVTVEVEKMIQKTFEFSIDEINFINLEEKLEIDKEKSQKNISITFEAVESIINSLSKDDITLTANLIDLKEGLHDAKLNIEKPSKIDIIKLSSEDFKVFLKMKTD